MDPVCRVCGLIIKPTEPMEKTDGNAVHTACLPPLTVTCAVVDGLLRVRVIGAYDFEDVKRPISAALDHCGDSAHAMVYDMRSAVSPPSADKVRERAAWIGGLRARGLRACAIVVVPGSTMMGTNGIAVLEAMDVRVRYFSTVAGAEAWASTQILLVADDDDTGAMDTQPSRCR